MKYVKLIFRLLLGAFMTYAGISWPFGQLVAGSIGSFGRKESLRNSKDKTCLT